MITRRLSNNDRNRIPPKSEAQRRTSNHGESHFSEVTQFHARYVNGTLLTKATINAGVTHVAHDDRRSSRQAI